jgi:hypothetical protein
MRRQHPDTNQTEAEEQKGLELTKTIDCLQAIEELLQLMLKCSIRWKPDLRLDCKEIRQKTILAQYLSVL